MPDRRAVAHLVLAMALGTLTCASSAGSGTSSALTAAPSGTIALASARTGATRVATHRWTYRRLHHPERVAVLDGRVRPVAIFTFRARTVNVRGPLRVLREPGTTTPSIRSHTRVRLLPRPFTGTVPTRWLRAMLGSDAPDVLAVALQYVTGARTVVNSAGQLVSSDASYGPLQPDGTRQEGSDFNDYLGITWTYGTVQDQPEPDQRRALDCSGFVRMVLGRRLRLPLTLDPDGVGLPRRAVQMLASAPGLVTIPDMGSVPSTRRLAPGDLLFFDADGDDGTAVDHVAIYLGRDLDQAPRFVSSRKSVDGPTMADVGGNSTLSGVGTYARTWRAARRP